MVFPSLGQREIPWNAWGHLMVLMWFCGDGVAESRAVGSRAVGHELESLPGIDRSRAMIPSVRADKYSILPLFSDFTPCAPQAGVIQTCLPKKLPSLMSSVCFLGLEPFPQP